MCFNVRLAIFGLIVVSATLVFYGLFVYKTRTKKATWVIGVVNGLALLVFIAAVMYHKEAVEYFCTPGKVMKLLEYKWPS